MTAFLVALSVFLGTHAIPAAPPIRRVLVTRLGAAGFLLAYSALSLAVFTWLLVAMLRAPIIPLWPPVPAAYVLAVVLVPFGFLLLVAGALVPNPLSVSLAPGAFDPDRPGVVAVTRHPILWGLALWGLAHVPPNGDLAPLIVFGSLGVFAVVGMLVMDRRKRRQLGAAAWSALAERFSFFPFVGMLRGRTRFPRDRRTWVGLLGGALLSLLFLAGLHLSLFHRDPLLFFR